MNIFNDDHVIEVEAIADVHVHLREGPIVKPLIQYSWQGGADVLGPMPNTRAGLIKADYVSKYNLNVKRLSYGHPLRTLPIVMITERTTPEDIGECADHGIVDGKLYSLNRTTLSHNGIRHYGRMLPIVRECGERKVKVHVHAEHPWMEFDNRDAEFVFLPIVDMFLNETEATIVWEHGSDARCIPFWKEMAKSGRFFVTLTAHHLSADEDSTFGDVRAVCKPPIKTRRDRADLLALVREDHDWVMAGSDSAYHDEHAKHTMEGKCACGDFTAPFLSALYAHTIIRGPDDIPVYNRFVSRNARKLHKLPGTRRIVKLARAPFTIPCSYPVADETALPFWAGQTLDWTIVGDECRLMPSASS